MRAESVACCANPRIPGKTDLDPTPVLNAYANTRMYEVRLAKADVDALGKRGMTVEDAVQLALVDGMPEYEESLP